MTPFVSLTVPINCLFPIGSDAKATIVTATKTELRVTPLLVGGELVPLYGFGWVSNNALAILIAATKV
jgi:hypothetical protein